MLLKIPNTIIDPSQTEGFDFYFILFFIIILLAFLRRSRFWAAKEDRKGRHNRAKKENTTVWKRWSMFATKRVRSDFETRGKMAWAVRDKVSMFCKLAGGRKGFFWVDYRANKRKRKKEFLGVIETQIWEDTNRWRETERKM